VRHAVAAVFGAHVAYGVVLFAAPSRITRSWLGPAVDGDPVKVALRALAGREILLHALGTAAALQGRPLRPGLAASFAGDLNDVVATMLGRTGIPDDSPRKTVAVAGGSAALTGALLALS
jgi:hypothetical protein